MIVKVVLPKNKHVGAKEPRVRVFTEDKKVNGQVDLTENLKKMMNGQNEAYFHAVIDEREHFTFLEKVNGLRW